jgi:glycosyltransferase involved in cell wall biosynthesis
VKIAFFVQYCHEAGTYFRWHNLAKALVLNGHTVHIYAGDFNYKAAKRNENRDNVEYKITPSLITSRIFGNPSDPLTGIYRCFNKVDKDYDVYHLFQPFLQAYIPWQWLKWFRKGVFIYDWDDLWTGGIFKKPHSFRDRYTVFLVKYLENKLPRLANGTTVCSSYLKDLAPQAPKVGVFYNGFWNTQNAPESIIEENRFAKLPGKYYLGYIGKTAAELDWIMQAAVICENKFPHAHFLLVGPPKNQVELSGLLNLTNISYLEQVSASEAKFITQKLDVGLLPLENNAFNRSRFPIKFFDYLVAGIPVYYSGVGELKLIGDILDYVVDGGSTKEEWVKNIESFLNNESYAKKLVIDINSLAKEYSWAAIASSLVDFYDESSIYE